MKTKKKCATCAKRFEPSRSDAKYCSSACKQKAHAQKKKADVQSKEPKMVFYLDEYEKLREHFGCSSEIFDLLFFCFLRKNISENTSHDNLVVYFNSIWTGDNYRELISTQAYRSFRENFLENRYVILSSKLSI